MMKRKGPLCVFSCPFWMHNVSSTQSRNGVVKVSWSGKAQDVRSLGMQGGESNWPLMGMAPAAWSVAYCLGVVQFWGCWADQKYLTFQYSPLNNTHSGRPSANYIRRYSTSLSHPCKFYQKPSLSARKTLQTSYPRSMSKRCFSSKFY